MQLKIAFCFGRSMSMERSLGIKFSGNPAHFPTETRP
jgi:hypothetical protein